MPNMLISLLHHWKKSDENRAKKYFIFQKCQKTFWVEEGGGVRWIGRDTANNCFFWTA